MTGFCGWLQEVEGEDVYVTIWKTLRTLQGYYQGYRGL